MKYTPLLISGAALALAGCVHPADKRWEVRTSGSAVATGEELPRVTAYSIETPASPAKTKLTELSDRGQAALIDALAKSGADAATLKALLAAPLAAKSESTGTIDRTALDRTLVVSVNKGLGVEPGDRLIRTIVTVKPRGAAGRAPFEFAGYKIAATDTRIQNIAHIESTTEGSLTASLAPKIGGFGDNGVGASLSSGHTSSADIVQQYEHLNIDIQPGELVITRESERGLDLAGNTLVELTLATPPGVDTQEEFIARDLKLFANGKPLPPPSVTLAVRPVTFLPACDLKADVSLYYVLRKITAGREHYTEGKQTVEILRGNVASKPFTLVRAADAQNPMFQIIVSKNSKIGAVTATLASGGQHRLLFDDFAEARMVATWLSATSGVSAVGIEGLRLGMGDQPFPAGSSFSAELYRQTCPY